MLFTLIPTPWPGQFNAILKTVTVYFGYDPLHIQSAADCKVMFTNLTSHNQCQDIIIYMSDRVQVNNHACETLHFGHCLHVVYETPVLVQLVPGIFPPFWGADDLPLQALIPHNAQALVNPPVPNQFQNPYHPNHHHHQQLKKQVS